MVVMEEKGMEQKQEKSRILQGCLRNQRGQGIHEVLRQRASRADQEDEEATAANENSTVDGLANWSGKNQTGHMLSETPTRPSSDPACRNYTLLLVDE